MRVAQEFVGGEGAGEGGERNGAAAGDAGEGELQAGGGAVVEGVGPAGLVVLRLKGDGGGVDPVGLQLIEDAAEQLGRGGLLGEDGGVAGDDPGFEMTAGRRDACRGRGLSHWWSSCE